jgi:RNA polymerase sigma-70 factor (ECF subfamily)
LAYARKHGLNEADAKDLAQKTLIRISKSLPAFVYEPEKHRFKAWLFTLAYRGLSDHWRQCRRLRPELPFPDVVTQEATDADPLANLADHTAPQPDATWDKIWQESMLQAALQRVKDRVRPAIMELYQYHVVEEHSVEVTVAEFRESGVTKEQVYLAKSRVLAMLEEELRKLRREFED